MTARTCFPNLELHKHENFTLFSSLVMLILIEVFFCSFVRQKKITNILNSQMT